MDPKSTPLHTAQDKLFLRQATPFDLPPILALLEDYKEGFQEDGESLDYEEIAQSIQEGNIWVIDEWDYAVGAVSFSDIKPGISAVIHLIVRPEYLRRVLKLKLIEQSFNIAFKELGVGKIKALPMETQKTAIKLLNRFKFYRIGIFRNETKQRGKFVDIIAFELHKKFWERHNG